MTGPSPWPTGAPTNPTPTAWPPTTRCATPILAAHRAAREAGATGYADPATGYLVMTSAYLAGRGACCHQGCRHCPYVV